MKTRTKLILFTTLILAAATLAACDGQRVTWFDKITPDGISAADGTLVRNYSGLNLMKTYNAIESLCKEQGWAITDRSSSSYSAEIDARDSAGVDVEFNIWSPPNAPTSIGIDHDQGRMEAVKLFGMLESRLPGKRVDPGAP